MTNPVENMIWRRQLLAIFEIMILTDHVFYENKVSCDQSNNQVIHILDYPNNAKELIPRRVDFLRL